MSYSQTNTAGGCTPPLTYSLVSGPLPAGTTLDASTGTVSGTPTTAGPFFYTIQVTDNTASTATAPSSGTILPGLTLTATASATTQVGQAYSQTNAASGGTTPYNYSLAFGTLPAGTTLDASTGTVSGTPTAAGNFSYTIQVTDGVGGIATATTSGTMVSALALTATASTAMEVGVSYSQTNVASGGTAPYVYSLVSGSLPAGTTLDASTGTVSGTPTTAGPFFYTIQVRDNTAATATAPSSGTILPGPTLTATASATTQVGQAYSQTNTASGGTTPYNYSLASGTLPAGTTLDASTGTVSGTPTTTGNFNYTIQVTDGVGAIATATTSGTIAPAGLTLTATASTAMEVGVGYSQTNVASGGTAPYAYSLVSGTLPAGTTLNASTGTVSGTPTTAGPFSYVIQVRDNVAATATAPSSGTILPGLILTATASATTQVGQAYSQTNAAGGGTTPYTYALASGTLPPGTTLNTATGTVSGTPTAAGAFSYTIQVTDGFGATATAPTSGTMASAALALTPTASAITRVGQSYSQTNVASGGTTPYTYSLASGALPAGTTLNTSTGTVSGTPTTAGPFSYTIQVMDGAAATATAATSGTIAPAVTALTITPTASAITQVGQSYSQTNVANGGTTPYVYSLASGTLPAGTTLSASTGTVSGTPTTAGPFSYTIKVTDSTTPTAQTATTTTISGTIAPTTLAITPTASAATQVGQAYSQTNVATGGTTPYAYTLASGALPAGTSLNTTTGTVSGTPTTAGPFSYAIKVTDSTTPTAQTATTTIVSGTIAATPTTTSLSSSVNPSVLGQPVTFTAAISGGSSPSGTVIFSDGGSQIGMATLAGTTATFTTSSLSLGSHAITAKYSGNANNAASTSPVLQQSVAVPVDSIRLRQMQVLGTQQSAQISGQNITGAVGNAINDAFSGNVQAVTPNGNGFTYNFAAEDPAVPQNSNRQAGGPASDYGVKSFVAAPDRNTGQVVEQAFSTLGYAGVTRAPPKATPAPPDWLAWIDVRGVSFNNHTSGSTDLSGNQLNVTAGLTRRLTPDVVVGGFGGVEQLDFNSDALNSRLKGDGWTVGGYLGWHVAPNMRFDMMLGRSAVGYTDTAGTAFANFPGVRWLASGGFTGTYDVQGLVLQPSAKVYALWEHDGAYIDSLGVAEPSYSFSTGRASTGTRVSYPFEWSSMAALAPYAGVYGDYYFTGNQAAVAGVPTLPLLLQGWSARVAAGLDMKFGNGGTIGVGGELGGIGSHTSVWTYKMRGSVPF